MKIEELKELQLTQLKMMDLIHNFCVNNDIKYYIIGGTLLGAIRHQGFIPWDLDIDIAMMRDDYNKFEKLSCNLHACLEYHNYKNFNKYSRPHCEITLKHSMIHAWMDKYNKRKTYNGIFIDVFPLDVVPNEEKLQKKQANKIKVIRRIIGFKDGTLYGNKGFFYKITKRLLSYILKPISYKYLGSILEKEMSKYNDCKTDLVCSMASRYDYFKQKMKIEIYGNPILLNFEGREYFAPTLCDEYLTKLYGDYMKLPSEEKRKGETDYFESVDYCYLPKKYNKGYTSGVYDMFHVGHLNILKEAKKACKYLVVGVTTDELSFERKGKKPIIEFENRCKIIQSIKYVDLVISQENMDKIDVIEKFNIDAVFVGSDWRWTESWLEYEEKFKKLGVDVIYLPHTDGISSTILRGIVSNE